VRLRGAGDRGRIDERRCRRGESGVILTLRGFVLWRRQGHEIGMQLSVGTTSLFIKFSAICEWFQPSYIARHSDFPVMRFVQS
jgi:hypothetical protein